MSSSTQFIAVLLEMFNCYFEFHPLPIQNFKSTMAWCTVVQFTQRLDETRQLYAQNNHHNLVICANTYHVPSNDH